jgi:hypothetical protein
MSSNEKDEEEIIDTGISDVDDENLVMTPEQEEALLTEDNPCVKEATKVAGKSSDKAEEGTRKLRKDAGERIEKKKLDKLDQKGKRKLSDNKTPEGLDKAPPKRGNNSTTPTSTAHASSQKPAANDGNYMEVDGEEDPVKTYSDATKEFKMIVLPSEYPFQYMTETEYHKFNSFLARQMDRLPKEVPLPNYMFNNFIQGGYASYTCMDPSSAVFLRKAACDFDESKKLHAIMHEELPNPPVFRSHTRDRDFTAHTFLTRLPRQNMGIGLDTSEWKVFNITKDKHGFAFMLEMDAPSAALITQKGGWLFYWLSTIKLVNVKQKEVPQKLTFEQLCAIGNTGETRGSASAAATNLDEEMRDGSASAAVEENIMTGSASAAGITGSASAASQNQPNIE